MIGASMKMLNTHRLQLAINCFNPSTIEPQVIVIRPRVWGHVAPTGSHKTYSCRGEDSQRIGVRDVAFVSQDRRAFRQPKGQFVKGCQILFGGSRGGSARWCLEHRVGQVGADYATGGVDLDGEIRRTTWTARLGWAGIGAGRPECEHRTRKQNEGFASTDQDGPPVGARVAWLFSHNSR